ncbi:MAG: EAL domain-containing protein [Methylococcaceae bacterium]|nr:EAL domain-containing protein [Methylococcaceae bacterium]
MLESQFIKSDDILILVVDDELVNRLYIKKALENEGYSVLTVENGQQAIEMANKHIFSLIVMDVMMPVMGGYDACIALRMQEHKLNVPIIMLTALDDIESVEKSFDAGATDFVVKPVNLPIFKQRVRHGLKTHETDVALFNHQLRLVHAHKVARLGYWDWDLKNNHLYWSDEVFNIYGLSSEVKEINYERFLDKVYEDDQDKIDYATRKSLSDGEPYSIEHRVLLPNGEFKYIHQHAELIKNEEGQVIRMLGIAQDITERHLAQEKIQHLAYYDSLTDLPNRTLFHDRLNHALERAGRSEEEVAVFLIDLDRFKKINDSLGHDIGDLFLQSVADSLKKSTRSADTISRLGGDEFALVIEGVLSEEGVLEVARKTLDALLTTHIIQGNELISAGSIGISISSNENRHKESLIKQADLAMYKSKEEGGNRFSFYNKEMKSRAHQMLILENELRKALEKNELVVHYQPKVCVKTDKIMGMEALIRWQHPEKGLIPPTDFVPIAEETGLIVPMGMWILEEACKQTSKWHQEGFSDLIVSINISAKQFHSKGFVDGIQKALIDSGITPQFVELEITESCTITDIDKTIRFLNAFRDMGMRISMDDFGTGFSSLSFLNQLPLDTLKVDRAFIKDINAEGENGELASLIIAMAKSLNLSVVAEGIETIHHLYFLQNSDCDEYQGFLASPPVEAKQFKELLILNLQKLAS